MSGRMPGAMATRTASLELLQPVEPLQPRRGGGIRALAPQADDDRVPLVKVTFQHLHVLIVADAGFHLDATARAVPREDVAGALLRPRVPRPCSTPVWPAREPPAPAAAAPA